MTSLERYLPLTRVPVRPVICYSTIRRWNVNAVSVIQPQNFTREGECERLPGAATSLESLERREHLLNIAGTHSIHLYYLQARKGA